MYSAQQFAKYFYTMASANIEKVADEFDWIQLSTDMAIPNEGFAEKFVRKVKENPFVPIGKIYYGVYIQKIM